MGEGKSSGAGVPDQVGPVECFGGGYGHRVHAWGDHVGLGDADRMDFFLDPSPGPPGSNWGVGGHVSAELEQRQPRGVAAADRALSAVKNRR
jgi:hypothetical protein